APRDVMLVMIPIGLGEFSKQDVERVFAPLDKLVDQLMERGCDIIMQSGVPLPLLIGVEAHDRLLDRINKRCGKPVTSSVIGVGAWLSEPVCQALEREFNKPCISNMSAMIWDTLTRLNYWRPIPGQGRLLAA